MESSGNLNLVPKHIMTSLYESLRLIVDFHIQFQIMDHDSVSGNFSLI